MPGNVEALHKSRAYAVLDVCRTVNVSVVLKFVPPLLRKSDAQERVLIFFLFAYDTVGRLPVGPVKYHRGRRQGDVHGAEQVVVSFIGILSAREQG